MTDRDRLDVLNQNERENAAEYKAGKIDMATFTARRAYYRGRIESIESGENERIEREAGYYDAPQGSEEKVEQVKQVAKATLPRGLYRYTIESEELESEVSIVAKSADQAWSKFCTQRFGSLKPNRSDWTIQVETNALAI